MIGVFVLAETRLYREGLAELDRHLTSYCADRYAEAEALTRDEFGRFARLLGRVIGPTA